MKFLDDLVILARGGYFSKARGVLPRTVKIKAGYLCYDRAGLRVWSDASGSPEIAAATVISIFTTEHGQLARIGFPLWSNGKEWCVEIAAVEEIVAPPPPSGVTKTHDIDVMSDGSLVIDGNPYP